MNTKFLVEMLVQTSPKFSLEIASKLPFIYHTRYMHGLYCKRSLQYGDCKNSENDLEFRQRSYVRLRSHFFQKDFHNLKIHIHDFYCEYRLNGGCRNNKAYQNFKFYCNSERTSLSYFKNAFSNISENSRKISTSNSTP